MTTWSSRHRLPPKPHPTAARSHRNGGGGWRVTSPRRCPKIRAVSPSNPTVSAPRHARDQPAPCWSRASPAALAAACARRRDSPERRVRVAFARACGAERDDTRRRYTSAGDQAPSTPPDTRIGTHYIVVARGVPPSGERYQQSTLLPRVISDEQTRVISDERCRSALCGRVL